MPPQGCGRDDCPLTNCDRDDSPRMWSRCLPKVVAEMIALSQIVIEMTPQGRGRDASPRLWLR